jgi:biopolymer transport protein ExbD
VKLTRHLKVHPLMIGVIPVINVLFLVVIFFAMSSRFVLQPGLAVNLPGSAFTLEPRPNAQLVSVISAPTPTIYHRNRKVGISELAEQLRHSAKEDRSLIIRADRGTPVETVMQIMNEALGQGFSVVLATNRERR